MQPKQNRTSVINMRTSAIDKEFLQKASEMAGYSNLTNFILTAARKEALQVLNATNTTYLSDRDWSKVTELLEHPPEPSEKLKKLMSKESD